MNRRILAALLMTVVVAAGCGKSNEVGSGVDLNIKDQAEEARLGESTTTVPPSSIPGDRGALGETTTTAPATTTTVQAVTLTIAVNGDSGSATQFEPSDARVYVGSLVEWVNNDSVARSVIADNGAFDSGEIPPGGTFRYSATAAGQIAYTDGTRPYAVGTLEVIAR